MLDATFAHYIAQQRDTHVPDASQRIGTRLPGAQLPHHVRLSSKPAGLAKIISTNVQYLRQDGLHLQRTMRALDEDPQLLKAWLKEQRRLFKEQESDFF